MTNPTATFRMLITYAVIIAVALLLGFMLPYVENFDRTSLIVIGLALALVLSPIFIKFHYPLLLFGLACPATMFFLPGRPPLWEIVVIISVFVAITERILNREKRFISVTPMTLPLLFIVAMALVTAKLTGGIQLHSIDGAGGGGGGKKYIALFLGVASYFALTSRVVPPDKRKLYLMLFMLPAVLGVIGALFPYLPTPLTYINLLFPPTSDPTQEVGVAASRFKAVAFAFSPIAGYMLARYGLSGILSVRHLWRPVLFAVAFVMSLMGGFRNIFGGMVLTMALMFLFERLYRTRLMPVLIGAGLLGATVLVSFSNQLPYAIQRSMCFLPLKWKPAVLVDADNSSEWRFRIWRAIWPKVPDYLLLGKGYALSQADYENMQGGVFANFPQSHISGDEEALAVSGDYHSGPLTTLIPFGIWGGIGIVWLMGAMLFVLYRNYRYGEPEMKTFNIYFFASGIVAVIGFLFIYGAFQDNVAGFAKLAGFSLAMNGGLAKRVPKAAYNAVIKPKSEPSPAGTPQPA